MKKFLIATLMVAGLLSGCGGGGSDHVKQGALRFINASADAPDLDVYVNGGKEATALSFPGFSYFLPYNEGTQHVQFRPVTPGANVLDLQVPLSASDYKTVVAFNDFGHIRSSVLVDDRSQPANGTMRVRLLHLSPSSGRVDIYFNNPNVNIANVSPTNANIPFETNLGYVTIPAGIYRFVVTRAGTKSVLLDSGSQSFASQEVRTIMLLDKKGGGTPELGLINYDLN